MAWGPGRGGLIVSEPRRKIRKGEKMISLLVCQGTAVCFALTSVFY